MDINNKKIQIHFFTKGDKNYPSSRLRAYLIAEKFNQAGIWSIVHWPPIELISCTKWPQKFKLIWATLKNLLKIKKGDIVFLQRTLNNKYFFVFIVLHKIIFNRKMIFDFDDAIYLYSFLKTKILTKLADVVIVGGRPLADWAKKYNKNVYFIPTCVSFTLFDKYSCFKREPNKKFTIGWTGNPGHYVNLKILSPVFSGLLKRGLQFKFILVGSMSSQDIYDLFRSINGLDVEFIDWQKPNSIPEIIQKFDVGLMPLISDEWSRGKCALKAIEYMACGVPAVVTPIGANLDLIRDGINGFFAHSESEWISRINNLAENKNLREKIGRAGQETVKENYSFEVNIPKLINIIKQHTQSEA